MTRVLILPVLAAQLGLAAASAQTPAASPQTLTIHAVAVDKQGNTVTDLKQDEVEVWMAGRRIPMAGFGFVDADDRSRAITLLIDDVTLTPTGLTRAREAARRLVAQMGPGDHVAVMRLSGQVARSTDDPAALRRAIDAIGLPAATSFMRPETLSEHVLTTLAGIAGNMSEAPARRRAIVAIGAGWLIDTPIPPVPGASRLQDAWSAAARALASGRVSLYVIDPGGVGMTPFTGGRSGFASDMGGHAFLNTNDLEGSVDRILREVATYYTIEIADPPFRRGDPLREVDVRVKRPDVAIRTHRLLPGR